MPPDNNNPYEPLTSQVSNRPPCSHPKYITSESGSRISGSDLSGSGPGLSGSGPGLSGSGPYLSGSGPGLSGSGSDLTGSGPGLSGSGPGLSGLSDPPPSQSGPEYSINSTKHHQGCPKGPSKHQFFLATFTVPK
jgi:hypothetical protein